MTQEWHPAACIFPMMPESGIQELAEDIKQNGLQIPIELCEGKVIDGRNRWMACLRLGIEPDTIEVDPDDPVAYVLSLNLHRRHLTTEQRGMVAARAKSQFESEAKERQKLSGGRGKKGKEILPDLNGQSRDKAGDALSVSGKTVDACEKVLKNGSKSLQEATDSAQVSADAAAKLSTLPKPKQNEIVNKALATNNPRKALADAAKSVNRIKTEDDPWSDSETVRKALVEKGHAVVANSHQDTRLIKWAEGEGCCVYIGRGTPWGNPFLLDKDGTRDDVCEKYSWYLDRKPSLDPSTLIGCVLVCFCHPQRCHGDELARRANDDS